MDEIGDSIDNSFKEFCCKVDKRNEAMAGTILFNSQQKLFEVGVINPHFTNTETNI